MKKIFILALCLNITTLTGAQETTSEHLPNSSDKFPLQEITFLTGHAWGELKQENSNRDYRAFPLAVYFGFRANEFLKLRGHKGEVQFGLEPFINPISDPEGGVELGVGIGAKYIYPLSSKVRTYIELSVAPMFLSVDTWEQGNGGFNFLDQGGAGFNYFIDDDRSITIGYRFRHLSHADFRSSSNSGINTHAVLTGFSLHY